MKNIKNGSILIITAILIFTLLFTGFSNVAAKAVTPIKKQTKPLRVITTYKPATDIVLALGGKDTLVGANDGAKKDILLMNLDKNIASNLVEVGSKKNGLNIEQIVALKPDVVIMYPTKKSDDTVKKLKALHIKVLSINPETFNSLQSDITKVGTAIGKSENSIKLVIYYKKKMLEISKRLATMKEKKTVYIAGANGVLSTCSGNYFQNEMVRAAGGVNVSSGLKGGWVDVSVEQVIAWNPEVIASVMYCPNGAPAKILQNTNLQTVAAIKNKNVYQIPSNISAWDMPQPSSILSILWLSKTLYPDKFMDWDIHKAANDFYKTFYGKSFDDLGGSLVGESSTQK